MTTKKKVRKIARSAITGRIVPLWYAELNPDTTVVTKKTVKKGSR
jgi:hypothetical protein